MTEPVISEAEYNRYSKFEVSIHCIEEAISELKNEMEEALETIEPEMQRYRDKKNRERAEKERKANDASRKVLPGCPDCGTKPSYEKYGADGATLYCPMDKGHLSVTGSTFDNAMGKWYTFTSPQRIKAAAEELGIDLDDLV